MKKIYLLLFCWSISAFVYAQKNANIWYFGKKAGVDFSEGKPKSLSDGVIDTEEGVATICDNAGKLLFYTDGIRVYNAKHSIMPNGKDLKGHPSSTQSGVVVPKIGSPTQYYLFSVPATADSVGLRYSIVDMTLQEGLGDVLPTAKNMFLHAPVTEKLTAVKHRNGKHIWVIAHEWNSDKFLAYLITEKGITTTPIISQAGSVHKGGSLNTQGYMKTNPDGTNLALALEDDQAVELFDFDSATGKVSNPLRINLSAKSYPYGVEFSPNGSLLYVSAAGIGKIYQYNLQTSPSDSIPSTKIEVGSADLGRWIGALQLAPNGKIYFPLYESNFLGVINEPNVLGKDCKYQNNAVALLEGKALLGLPTFIQSYFEEHLASSKVRYFEGHKLEIGDKLVLKNVNFDYAQYSLQPTSFVELDKLAQYLQKHPKINIKLIGHTDNIGNKPANITLSLNRAKAVKAYLVGKQIAESRISYEGFGSGIPIATNDTDEGRAKNRRVEMEVVE
jgi:outer membrane protein OmpA-like peptidoglycan-associated protein